MILAAKEYGCVREVLIITAALSIQDPRERPADAREAADAMHARFAEPGSDFLAFLTMWDYLHERQRELSGSAFRRMCRREYLHFLRVREWQDIYGQLRQAARDIGVGTGREEGSAKSPGRQSGSTQRSTTRAPRRESEPGARVPAELADRVHMSLLAGLLSHIGMKDAEVKRGGQRRGPAEFAGARGARFAIFPDSVLAKKPPQWVVAAELVETSRLWARVAAHIDPEWAEPLAAHLVKRGYSEPHWDARRGAAMARGGAQGQLRARRPLSGPGPVHHQCPGGRRLADPPQVLPAQPAAARRRQGPGGQGPAARPGGRRRGRFRLLRPADTQGRDVRAAFRRLVEEGPGAGP